ncbi:MAG: ABC transporter substrate-binding protein [Promethearchaeota archaeon]
MRRDQLTAIILIGVMIVGAGGVLVFATQPTRPPVDAYVYDIGEGPNTLDPYTTFWGSMIEQVYETLYTYPWGSGEHGDHPEITPSIPLLAAGAPVITENGTVYTIPLRQGINFHDGTPFNASAAVWNLKRAMKMFHISSLIVDVIKGGMQVKDAASTYGTTSDEFKAAFDAWDATDAVEATDTYEVTYRLEQPAAHFIPAMTNTFGCMISPTFAEKHATSPGVSFGVDYGEEITYMYNHTCGTGPYQVVEWKTGEYVHMTLNEDYWRADATEAAIAPPSYAGSIKDIWCRIDEDWTITSLCNDFRNGVVDALNWPWSQKDEIYDSVTMSSKDPNIFIRTDGVDSFIEGIRFEMGLLNWTGHSEDYEAYSPFHWRALRNMVAYLLDYDAIVQGAYGFWALRAEGPIPIGMCYHNASYWTEHYDPEIAVEYWNEAMQDPEFIDTMNTIGCQIPLACSYSNSTLDLVYLQLRDGFEAMKQLPQMNTTGLDCEPKIRFWTPWLYIYRYYDVPIGNRGLIGHSWCVSSYADPDGFLLSCLYSRCIQAQQVGYNNSVMDDLIMQGRAETDPVARQDIYNQIQELAAYDSPYLWLYSFKEFSTFGAWLKGIGMRYQPMSRYYYIYHVYKDYTGCWWDYTTTTDTTTTDTTTTTGPTGDQEPQPLGLYPLVLGGSGVVIAVAAVYIIYRKRSDIAAATEAVLWGT